MPNGMPELFVHLKNNELTEDNFNIEGKHISELAEFLTTIWNKNETISFWHLEDLFNDDKGNEWCREKLIGACRYLYLNHFFDQVFWQAMLQYMTPDSPVNNIVLRHSG